MAISMMMFFPALIQVGVASMAGMIALNLPSPLMAVLALLAGILILVGR